MRPALPQWRWLVAVLTHLTLGTRLAAHIGQMPYLSASTRDEQAPWGMRTSLTAAEAAAYRLAANHLTRRLPAGGYVEAAHVGLQDTAPRDALVGLHARVESSEPSAWEVPGLIQTYGPRQAVYVLPEDNFSVFTLGRLPREPAAQRALQDAAEEVCRELAGQERQGALHPQLRMACATGRLAVRWTASALIVREVAAPTVDVDDARVELCRRHVHDFGPTTPQIFRWWAGVSLQDARETWQLLVDELVPVDLDGQTAWMQAEDEASLSAVEQPRGVRLLVASDLRLLGQDRTGLFVGPGLRPLSPLHDSLHPNGVLVEPDRRRVGPQARQGRRVYLCRTARSDGGGQASRPRHFPCRSQASR